MAPADVKGCLTPDATTLVRGSKRVVIHLDLAVNNSVARLPVGIGAVPLKSKSSDPPIPKGLVPDADIEGTIVIDAEARKVEFRGKIDRFPFFEMYASTDRLPKADGDIIGKEVFTAEPKAGDNVWHMPCRANREMTKEVIL